MARTWRLRLPPVSNNPDVDGWRREVVNALADVRFNFISTTTHYAMDPTDQIVQAETASMIVTLPSAVDVPGKWVPSVKNTSAGAVFVIAPGTQTIDSATTFTLGPLDSISVYSDSTNWNIS